jgi:hypothetical protein
LGLSVSFEKDTLQLLEEWNFTLEIKNTSAADVDMLLTEIVSGCGSMAFEIKLEIRNQYFNSWTDTKVIKCMYSPYGGSGMYKLKPNEHISYQFRCNPPIGLLDFGTNEIRVSCANFFNSTEDIHYSVPMNLDIIPPKGQDLAAFNYLKRLPEPDFILAPLFRCIRFDTSKVLHVAYIINHFPESSLAEYGKLYMANIYKLKGEIELRKREPNVEKAVKYFRSSKNYGIELLSGKDPAIQKASNDLLYIVSENVLRSYNYMPPDTIEKEFTFPFKR